MKMTTMQKLWHFLCTSKTYFFAISNAYLSLFVCLLQNCYERIQVYKQGITTLYKKQFWWMLGNIYVISKKVSKLDFLT